MENKQPWGCTISYCAYVYNPVYGDPSQGIPVGTGFEVLPSTWLCPTCRAGKEYFVPIKI